MKKIIDIHYNSTVEDIFEDLEIEKELIPKVAWIRITVNIPPIAVNMKKETP